MENSCREHLLFREDESQARKKECIFKNNENNILTLPVFLKNVHLFLKIVEEMVRKILINVALCLLVEVKMRTRNIGSMEVYRPKPHEGNKTASKREKAFL